MESRLSPSTVTGQVMAKLGNLNFGWIYKALPTSYA
jgi:hypothetical protein